MPYFEAMDGRTGLVDANAVREKGTELAASYAAAAPFPNVVIDDFLPPDILDMVLDEFAGAKDVMPAGDFDRSQERFKASFSPDVLPERLRNLFYSFNSKPFIRVLENITGINVLIYLNKDWQPEYGGQLELWDTEMTKPEHSIVPLFNRCVIFNTTSNSQHGNPNVINHPRGITRKSIALYYYTSTWDGTKRSHTTQFQVRPGTTDRRDSEVQRSELLNDCLPPAVMRNYLRARRRIGKLVRRQPSA